ncbi:MAG: hypothetical protein ABIM89_09150 [Mycobacteriales bacterium]
MDEYLRLTPAPGGAVSERMQALLSKAVEEQVHEQREVQSLLADVRNALADVQRDARVAPGGQDDVRQELAAHAADTRSRLAQLDDRLQAIVGAVSTSAQVLQGISGQLERLVESGREQATNAVRSEPLAQIRYEVAELRTRIDSAAEQTALTVAGHVDNAVLVLAEALLRRPGGGGSPIDLAQAPAPRATYSPEGLPTGAATVPDTESRPDAGAQPDAGAEPAVEAEPAPEMPHSFAPEAPADSAAGGAGPLVGSSLPWSPAEDPPARAAHPSTEPDDDDAGGLVDDARPAPTSGSTREAGAPYDDPLGDLPAADEPRHAFPVAQAPYDLERALFGNRARPVVAEPEVDDERAPTAASPRTPSGRDDIAPADEEEPRRRPWWRPST